MNILQSLKLLQRYLIVRARMYPPDLNTAPNVVFQTMIRDNYSIGICLIVRRVQVTTRSQNNQLVRIYSKKNFTYINQNFVSKQ